MGAWIVATFIPVWGWAGGLWRCNPCVTPKPAAAFSAGFRSAPLTGPISTVGVGPLNRPTRFISHRCIGPHWGGIAAARITLSDTGRFSGCGVSFQGLGTRRFGCGAPPHPSRCFSSSRGPIRPINACSGATGGCWGKLGEPTTSRASERFSGQFGGGTDRQSIGN